MPGICPGGREDQHSPLVMGNKMGHHWEGIGPSCRPWRTPAPTPGSCQPTSNPRDTARCWTLTHPPPGTKALVKSLLALLSLSSPPQ